MLGSLLKYDFRALNKIMLPLQLGVLAAGIIGTICFNIFYRAMTSYNTYYSTTSSMIEGFTEVMAMLGAITLFSLVYLSGFITLLLIARNAYKSFYSSEGYLTFTLPVSMDKHIISKSISGLSWSLINALIIIASTVFLLVFGFAHEGLISFQLIETIGRELADSFLPPMGIFYLIEIIFIGLVSLLYNVLQIIFSIVLGGALARTHKVLAAIGIYLLSSMAMGFISSVFSLIVSMGAYAMSSSYSSIMLESQPLLIVTLIVTLGFSVGFYFLSRVSLKKNLNLD